MQGQVPEVSLTGNNNEYEKGCYLADSFYPKWKVLVQKYLDRWGDSNKNLQSLSFWCLAGAFF
jgi:hypothetical protein